MGPTVVGQTVHPTLGGDSGTPRAGPNVDLAVPGVCPTSSQNLQLRNSISFSSRVQSTKHSGFSLVCPVFSRQPLHTVGYPVLFQTKQTLLQALVAFCSFYQSCCCIPDSFHASISFPGRNDLAYKAALGRCFPFPAGSCTTFRTVFSM